MDYETHALHCKMETDFDVANKANNPLNKNHTIQLMTNEFFYQFQLGNLIINYFNISIK